MANLFCKSLDFRSFSAVSKTGLFSHGPKKFKANWMRIRRKRALHLTLICELPQPEVGVISSHEHADGSVSFRFGELVKGKEILEPDERGKESEEGYAVLKVSDREGDSSMEYVDTAVQEIPQLEKSVATLVGSDERVEETHLDSLKFNPENDEANQNLFVSVTEDHITETEITEAAECSDSAPSCSEKTKQSSFEEIRGTNIQDEMQNMLDINSPPKEVTEILPLSFEITELEASDSSEERR